jgi:hypothetical protein
MALGALLDSLRSQFGSYELVDHWQQGEFHHDIVVRLARHEGLPGPVLVVATNCNGGVKEVLSFALVPDRFALWKLRCPDNPEFQGDPPDVLARESTPHWFDPCELLRSDARTELRPEYCERQFGGGWQRKSHS